MGDEELTLIRQVRRGARNWKIFCVVTAVVMAALVATTLTSRTTTRRCSRSYSAGAPSTRPS